MDLISAYDEAVAANDVLLACEIAKRLNITVEAASRLNMATWRLIAKAHQEGYDNGAAIVAGRTPAESLRAAMVGCGASEMVAKRFTDLVAIMDPVWTWRTVALSMIARLAGSLRDGDVNGYVPISLIESALADIIDPAKPLDRNTPCKE